MHVQWTSRQQHRPECLTPSVRGFDGSVTLARSVCCHGLGPLEGRVAANQYNSLKAIYPVMKHLCPVEGGVFKDHNAPIHGARGFTRGFNEDGNDVNRSLWPLQPPDLNQAEHLQ